MSLLGFWRDLTLDVEGGTVASPLPDERVRLHALAATMLGRVEKKPPGWGDLDWSIYLMDLPYLTLRKRLYPFRYVSKLTTLFPNKQIPAVLNVKMMSLQGQWVEEYVLAAVNEVLGELTYFRRDANGLRSAHQLVGLLLRKLEAEIGRVHPFRVKLTMAKDGTISPTLRRF